MRTMLKCAIGRPNNIWWARTRWSGIVNPFIFQLPHAHAVNSFRCYHRPLNSHNVDSLPHSANTDPRLEDLGRKIEGEYATIREKYGKSQGCCNNYRGNTSVTSRD